MIAVSIIGPLCGAKLVEDIGFSCQREFCDASVIGNTEAGGVLTWSLNREVISLAQT